MLRNLWNHGSEAWFIAVQAGGYFSICVCISTWWLALAELVFDVTGKVGPCLFQAFSEHCMSTVDPNIARLQIPSQHAAHFAALQKQLVMPAYNLHDIMLLCV